LRPIHDPTITIQEEITQIKNQKFFDPKKSKNSENALEISSLPSAIAHRKNTCISTRPIHERKLVAQHFTIKKPGETKEPSLLNKKPPGDRAPNSERDEFSY
jgi:hypothetical protein